MQPDDLAIEIGPGRGALTALLAKRVYKVMAIEIDRTLAQSLQGSFPPESNVEIITADVLRVSFSVLCRQAGVTKAFVLGNIPYYVTSPILHHVFGQRSSIRAMGLLVQREVAERLIAEPGTRAYGYLSVATQIYCQPEIALAVPPGAFSPPPKVQSALVTFRMRAKFKDWPQSNYDAFLQFVKHCFAQKRKNLLNNLGGIYRRTVVAKALQEMAKPPHTRAEELSTEEFAGLFERLAPGGKHA